MIRVDKTAYIYSMNKKSLVWFDEVGKDDVGLVGGKGANLGEMTRAHFPIPYGFVVTSKAYFDFIEKSKLQPKIKSLLSIINYDNPSELQQASEHIKKLIIDSQIPSHLMDEISTFYGELVGHEEKYIHKQSGAFSVGLKKLTQIYDDPIVAVRSSATAEDLPNASFAGQQETYLNVRGDSHVIQKVRECWASLFTPRAIYYRHQQGFDHFRVGLAAVIQRMVQSEKSGIAFSIDPVTNDKSKIVIEAIFGLGEYIVGGKVTPDHYEVEKRSFLLIKKEIKQQKIALKKFGNGNKEFSLSKNEAGKQKISDEEIISVAMLVKEIEQHYFFPQDIEWAIEKGRTYIVQSRPITTIKQVKSAGVRTNRLDGKSSGSTDFAESRLPILTGSPASPGVGVGPANVIFSPKEIDKIKHGDILVAPQTNPDYVPAMKKAAGIVTEKGGRTSHAAIVSRELGIPAVVGAERATKVVRSGEIITVNGASGEVFKGKVLQKTAPQEKLHHFPAKTLTHVYVNLAEPEQAQKISKMHVDGVGLLRAEFIIAQIGKHPKEYIKEKKEYLFVNKLAKDLITFAKAFSPRPVIYRATDFKTNEYRNLIGGIHYEPKEENPMLGFRGAYRYIANPDVFHLELAAIRKIYEMGYTNLQLMIPFVRVPWELIKIKELVNESGINQFPGFKLLIMVEVPACALHLEEFIKIGIDGVSIGTNDLTMMLLGVDRDNQEVSDIYDERHPVVVDVLTHIVETGVKHGVTVSICGQAASDYPDLVDKLVRLGITSVSVNPDAVDRTRELIYNIEKKLYSK